MSTEQGNGASIAPETLPGEPLPAPGGPVVTQIARPPLAGIADDGAALDDPAAPAADTGAGRRGDAAAPEGRLLPPALHADGARHDGAARPLRRHAARGARRRQHDRQRRPLPAPAHAAAAVPPTQGAEPRGGDPGLPDSRLPLLRARHEDPGRGRARDAVHARLRAAPVRPCDADVVQRGRVQGHDEVDDRAGRLPEPGQLPARDGARRGRRKRRRAHHGLGLQVPAQGDHRARPGGRRRAGAGQRGRRGLARGLPPGRLGRDRRRQRRGPAVAIRPVVVGRRDARGDARAPRQRRPGPRVALLAGVRAAARLDRRAGSCSTRSQATRTTSRAKGRARRRTGRSRTRASGAWCGACASGSRPTRTSAPACTSSGTRWGSTTTPSTTGS